MFRYLVRVTLGSALLGFVIGAAHAATLFLSREHVLEFQAGPPDPFATKARAIAQAAAIEGLGWGALGLVLGLFAAIAALCAPGRRHHPLGERFTAAFLLFVAGLAGFMSLRWLGDEALPFLSVPEALLFGACGVLVFTTLFALFTWMVRRIPFAPDSLLATTLVGALVAGGLLTLAQEVFFAVSGGYRSPIRIAVVAGAGVVGLVGAALLARLCEDPVERVAERHAHASVLPVSVSAVLGLLLFGATLWSTPAFHLSAVSAEVAYETVTPSSPATGPNIVFVTIDTLRADGLSCYGYERPTSPFIDSLAAEGTRFADPVAAASWTKPATGSIFTGLYPSRHGALYHGSTLRLPEGERTLAEALQAEGYVTAGFVSNPNIKAAFDFDRGFDVFFDSPVEDTVTLACIRGTWFGRTLMGLTRHQFNWKYENDVRQMNQHVSAWLQRNTEHPFYLYVHYIDPHVPYDPPPEWRGEFAGDHGLVLFEARKRLVGRDLYDAEVRYTDQGLRELVQTLKALGLWDDTLFVLTSDHGEEFFEHEVHGHGFSLFQPVVRVPLILHGRGVPAGRVVEPPVQIVDLPATLLALIGLDVERFGDGVSFAGALSSDDWRPEHEYFLESEFGTGYTNQRAFVFSGVRMGRYKLVLTEANANFPPQNPENDAQALYDLEQDPLEQHNLIQDPEHREIVEELLAELERHARFLSETGFRDIEPAALSPEIQANLEALGYAALE